MRRIIFSTAIVAFVAVWLALRASPARANPMAVQGALWADAAPTGLASFRNRGAKMLIHFGLNDTSSFYDVAQYYEGIQREIARSERLTDAAAGRQLRESIRLFTLPGVEHCGGGNGPNTMFRNALRVPTTP